MICLLLILSSWVCAVEAIRYHPNENIWLLVWSKEPVQMVAYRIWRSLLGMNRPASNVSREYRVSEQRIREIKLFVERGNETKWHFIGWWWKWRQRTHACLISIGSLSSLSLFSCPKHSLIGLADIDDCSDCSSTFNCTWLECHCQLFKLFKLFKLFIVFILSKLFKLLKLSSSTNSNSNLIQDNLTM